MYFTPLLHSEVKKGPYFIVENRYWLNGSKLYYFGEIAPPYLPYYTTLTNVYKFKDEFIEIPNKIQLETASLTFFKLVPTVLPKLRQRMLHQILRKITGDETFTYYIFEPELFHYTLHENELVNNLYPIKHVK